MTRESCPTDTSECYLAVPSCDLNLNITISFSSFEEYEEKIEVLTEKHPELTEFRIECVDSEYGTYFDCLEINQNNLEDWFDLLDNIQSYQLPAFHFLVSYMEYDLDLVTESLDDVPVFEGTPKECVEDFLSESGMLSQVPETLQPYIDYARFIKDLELNGELHHFGLDGKDYVVIGVF